MHLGEMAHAIKVSGGKRELADEQLKDVVGGVSLFCQRNGHKKGAPTGKVRRPAGASYILREYRCSNCGDKFFAQENI